MGSLGGNGRGETEAHLRLKRLALVWAQVHGYSACGLEVTLPRCRYRADLAAFRTAHNGFWATAIFECKQAREDLRRDNGCADLIRKRLETVDRRRQILEKHLRIHYPSLRIQESLFPEFDPHNFTAIEHRGYRQVLRETAALQNRLFDCTKFETLVRYQCSNLFFLVLPNDLWNETEVPPGWGALVESNGELFLRRKAVWHEITPERQRDFLERIAIGGTRGANRQLGVTFEEVQAARARMVY
jgi:hypothetical protein